MKQLSKDKILKVMMIAGVASVSMAVGMVAGCLKEKLKMNSCCIIDEL